MKTDPNTYTDISTLVEKYDDVRLYQDEHNLLSIIVIGGVRPELFEESFCGFGRFVFRDFGRVEIIKKGTKVRLYFEPSSNPHLGWSRDYEFIGTLTKENWKRVLTAIELSR